MSHPNRDTSAFENRDLGFRKRLGPEMRPADREQVPRERERGPERGSERRKRSQQREGNHGRNQYSTSKTHRRPKECLESERDVNRGFVIERKKAKDVD